MQGFIRIYWNGKGNAVRIIDKSIFIVASVGVFNHSMNVIKPRLLLKP